MARNKNRDQREKVEIKPEEVGSIESLGLGLTEGSNETAAETVVVSEPVATEEPVAAPAPVPEPTPEPTPEPVAKPAPKASKVKPTEFNLADAVHHVVNDERWKAHWDVPLAKHAAAHGITGTATLARWKTVIASFGIKTK